MIKPKVISTKFKPLGLILTYENDSILLIKPNASYGILTFIDEIETRFDGLESILLYKKNNLEAFVIPNDYSVIKGTSGFWSKQNMTQQEFAEYIASAIEYSELNYGNFVQSKLIIDYGHNLQRILELEEYPEFTGRVPFYEELPKSLKY